MLRASATDRNDFYAKGKQWGFLNTNMILEMEQLNPVDEDWAEKYWEPVNMADAEASADMDSADRGASGATGTPPSDEDEEEEDGKDSGQKDNQQ